MDDWTDLCGTLVIDLEEQWAISTAAIDWLWISYVATGPYMVLGVHNLVLFGIVDLHGDMRGE